MSVLAERYSSTDKFRKQTIYKFTKHNPHTLNCPKQEMSVLAERYSSTDKFNPDGVSVGRTMQVPTGLSADVRVAVVSCVCVCACVCVRACVCVYVCVCV